jgi:hypothetical protein
MHRTTATRPGRPDRPPIPSPPMIFSSRRGTIRGPRATHHEGAVRLMSSTRCQSPRLTWSSGSRCWTPALLTRTPPAVLQEQGVELLMALGEVPGREGGQRRRGEPEDPDRREVGHSTAVRGGAEPADPSLGLILRAAELRGQGTGRRRYGPDSATATAPTRSWRPAPRRSAAAPEWDGDRDDLDALNKAVVAVDAVSFTPLQDQLQSVLATLSEREAGVVSCGSG